MDNAACYFFSYFLEAIIIWQYASRLFAAKHSRQCTFAVLSGLYFTLFFISLYECTWLNAMTYLGANFIFLFSQYELKWGAAFFHSSILTAVMGMCELMAYGMFKFFSPQFLDNGRNFTELMVFALFNKTLFLTVIYILAHTFRSRHTDQPQNDKSVYLLILIPLTSVFVMLTILSIGASDGSMPPNNWMVVLSAAFLLLSNLLVFGINQYTQNKGKEFMELQLLLQKESATAQYYEMLCLQNENQRILIHDIKNHLHSIDMLSQNQAYDKISAYISKLLHSSDLQTVARICGHELLNSVLCRYARQCTDRHIKFHADIRSGTVDFIADNDITSLFCNLLDNALEAADGMPDAFVEISAANQDNTPFTVITMLNSCPKNPFSGKNQNPATTKPDCQQHGFGLKSIRRIVKKYGGDMKMYYEENTLTFHTILTLKKSAWPICPQI